MIRKVLLVDDDQDMLLALEEGFQKYRENFSVLLAPNGKKAIESLKRSLVSLVVTDLKNARNGRFRSAIPYYGVLSGYPSDYYYRQ